MSRVLLDATQRFDDFVHLFRHVRGQVLGIRTRVCGDLVPVVEVLATLSVLREGHDQRLLATRCKLVRSKLRGTRSCFGRSSTVTVMDLAAAMSASTQFLFHVKDATGLVFRRFSSDL